MDVSPVSTGALSGAMSSGSDVQQQLALVAIRSSEQSQNSILQLFKAADTPAPETGRGQNLNLSV